MPKAFRHLETVGHRPGPDQTKPNQTHPPTPPQGPKGLFWALCRSAPHGLGLRPPTDALAKSRVEPKTHQWQAKSFVKLNSLELIVLLRTKDNNQLCENACSMCLCALGSGVRRPPLYRQTRTQIAFARLWKNRVIDYKPLF